MRAQCVEPGADDGYCHQRAGDDTLDLFERYFARRAATGHGVLELAPHCRIIQHSDAHQHGNDIDNAGCDQQPE
jgi:hypothetical protein